MGSRTIDFSIDFGDEFCVRVIKPQLRSPQIPTPICGCKNQQNIENQCFYGDTISQKHAQSRNAWLCVDPQRFGESFGKVFPTPQGVRTREIEIQWQWRGLRSILRRDRLGSPASIFDWFRCFFWEIVYEAISWDPGRIISGILNTFQMLEHAHKCPQSGLTRPAGPDLVFPNVNLIKQSIQAR